MSRRASRILRSQLIGGRLLKRIKGVRERCQIPYVLLYEISSGGLWLLVSAVITLQVTDILMSYHLEVLPLVFRE